MKTAPTVGIFAEGSHSTDPHRDDFTQMWQLLAQHCGYPAKVKIIPIEKGHIIRLAPAFGPARVSATKLVQERGLTQRVGGGEALDVLLARTIRNEVLNRVIIAFDSFPTNQLLSRRERDRPCQMRAEVAFTLRWLAKSNHLPRPFREAAERLWNRYSSDAVLVARPRADEPLEVVFMEPMFEAIFVRDETTVRNALGFSSKPKDWPRFKTRERKLDKFVLDPAVECKERRHGVYLASKAKWGLKFVRTATSAQRASLWDHPIAQRLCRALAA